jgi:hypothetical protein
MNKLVRIGCKRLLGMHLRSRTCRRMHEAQVQGLRVPPEPRKTHSQLSRPTAAAQHTEPTEQRNSVDPEYAHPPITSNRHNGAATQRQNEQRRRQQQARTDAAAEQQRTQSHHNTAASGGSGGSGRRSAAAAAGRAKAQKHQHSGRRRNTAAAAGAVGAGNMRAQQQQHTSSACSACGCCEQGCSSGGNIRHERQRPGHAPGQAKSLAPAGQPRMQPCGRPKDELTWKDEAPAGGLVHACTQAAPYLPCSPMLPMQPTL